MSSSADALQKACISMEVTAIKIKERSPAGSSADSC